LETRVLTPEQIEKVNKTSLDVLERVGIIVPHQEMLSRFADAGASVDFESQRVKIPAEMVMNLLSKAGKQFTIYGRDLSKKAEFGYGQRNYNSIAGEASWLDNLCEERRYATMSDVATAARFADGLDGLTIAGAMADPHGVPVSYRCVEVMATMIRNTTKPIYFWFHDRASAKYLIDVMVALRGDEKKASEFPICYPLMEPISPLRFPYHGIDLLFETSKINLPLHIGPMAQMGVSAPSTIAGTIAVENAEILAGICITQLVKPGMPVCYGGICHAFDMATTQMIFCGPEQAILGVAMTQMGKHYGLPVYINVGLSDSKRPDAQAGLETGVTLSMGAAAGADIFGHMGICGVDQAASLDMLVLQNEVISYVESVMREVNFSDDALGFDVIDAVGPGGNFIDSEHTARHFRNELWFPRLLDRRYYQEWLDSGADCLEDRCRERKEAILQNHKPEPVSEDLDKALDEIVAAAKTGLKA
jgi:trimethylamine--corrinoid protein Co-methyltransferase